MYYKQLGDASTLALSYTRANYKMSIVVRLSESKSVKFGHM